MPALRDDLRAKIKEEVEVLSAPAGAMDAIATAIEDANDDCCGCTWPSEVADLLRGHEGRGQ